VILAAVVVGAFALAGGSNDKKTADTTPTKSTLSSSSTPTATPTTEAPTTNAAAKIYCDKLRTIDHDARLLGMDTKNPSDVRYAIRRFNELGRAAPPSISADWVKVNKAIAKAIHGQKPNISTTELQTAFDHIKSEALSDCSYALSGGAFDN
jgi:hypothetical protein